MCDAVQCVIDQAGITTTLNSRCSVLAAANGVYGRWDDTKGAENIDFMPTILSRFDMIFVVRDEHDMNRDMVSTLIYISEPCMSVCLLLSHAQMKGQILVDSDIL